MTNRIEELSSKMDDEILLRADLSYFAEEILGLEIAEHHLAWSKLVANHSRLAINASRDSGKSFMFSFAYPIWRAYFNWIPVAMLKGAMKSIPRISVGYIFSNTMDQAIKLLELVKHEIESNPKLHHLIPANRSLWSKTEIRLSNNAQIRARGWGQSVRGAHPTWGICDDVLNDETIYSELVRRKQIEYFYSAVTPMIVPGGQLVVVGTPLHVDDLYGSLAKNPIYTFKKFPALKENGESIWPARHSKESLMNKKKEIGSTRFAREYNCIPIDDSSSLFPERILSPCYDETFSMPSQLTKEDHRELRVFTGVDFAMSSTVGADFTVITTLGVDKFQNRWILDIRRKKGMSLSEQLREIENVNRLYRPLKVFVEDNAMQRIFRDELIRNTDVPVEGFTTSAYNKNALDKGVPSLQILFENRKFIIPRKTARDREITDVLIGELRNFSWMDGKLQGVGGHDDCVMSLWIASEACSSSNFNFSFSGDE